MKHSDNKTVILVFAKAPIPGQVKTRLIPALGEAGAAHLHAKLLQHTLDTLCSLDSVDVQLYGLSPAGDDYLPTRAERYGIPLKAQQGHNLGERMASAFTDNLDEYDKIILVGCDCPTLSVAHYQQAMAQLDDNDAVIIPAHDGGYVLLGLQRQSPALFEDIDWSTSRVLEQTRERLKTAGFRWWELTPEPDIDRPEDLAHCPDALLTGVAHEMAG